MAEGATLLLWKLWSRACGALPGAIMAQADCLAVAEMGTLRPIALLALSSTPFNESSFVGQRHGTLSLSILSW